MSALRKPRRHLSTFMVFATVLLSGGIVNYLPPSFGQITNTITTTTSTTTTTTGTTVITTAGSTTGSTSAVTTQTTSGATIGSVTVTGPSTITTTDTTTATTTATTTESTTDTTAAVTTGATTGTSSFVAGSTTVFATTTTSGTSTGESSVTQTATFNTGVTTTILDITTTAGTTTATTTETITLSTTGTTTDTTTGTSVDGTTTGTTTGVVSGTTTGTSVDGTSNTRSPSTSTSPNQFTSPDNAFTSNDVYATGDANNEEQGYKGFGFSVPGAATIVGIEVIIEGNKGTCTKDTIGFDVKLSQNGGTSYAGNLKHTDDISDLLAADSSFTLGSPTDLWGFSGANAWDPADINSDNFALKVKDHCSGGSGSDGPINLDAITATIFISGASFTLTTTATTTETTIGTTTSTITLTTTDTLVTGTTTGTSVDGTTTGITTGTTSGTSVFSTTTTTTVGGATIAFPLDTVYGTVGVDQPGSGGWVAGVGGDANNVEGPPNGSCESDSSNGDFFDLTGFYSSFPSAIITGVQVHVKYISADNDVVSAKVQLRTTVGLVGTPKDFTSIASPADCPDTDWVPLGGPGDTWGASLTGADINSDFGVRLTSISTGNKRVDSISIIIYYDPTGTATTTSTISDSTVTTGSTTTITSQATSAATSQATSAVTSTTTSGSIIAASSSTFTTIGSTGAPTSATTTQVTTGTTFGTTTITTIGTDVITITGEIIEEVSFGKKGHDTRLRDRGYAFGGGGAFGFQSDETSPDIEEWISSPTSSVKLMAKIRDNVAVQFANIIVGKTSFPMERWEGNPLWWVGVIPSQDGGSVAGTIRAIDYSKNVGEASFLASTSKPTSSQAPAGASFSVSPMAVSGYQPDSRYSIVANGLTSDDQVINPQITIKNKSTEPLQNIRIMLSPELKGKFVLSEYAVKKIEPNSEVTITLHMNGNPNVDVMKNPIPYNGDIIISIDNHTPYVLKLAGEIQDASAALQSTLMKLIQSKGEQRYRTFEKPDLRMSETSLYQVTLGSGENVIKNASDEIIIKNTGDKPLKNIHIITSSIGHHFLPDQSIIASIPVGSYAKVQLVSKMNNVESPRDLKGELLIVPDSGASVTIPINIGKRTLEDKNALYDVSTISGRDVITNVADGIVIKNNSDEVIENVRMIVPNELSRIFSLSENSMRYLEPHTQAVVYMKPRGTVESIIKQIRSDYVGEILIASSDGMRKTIPINLTWKGISSEHFVVYARDSSAELTKAAQVINFLERSYGETTKLLGEPKSKTLIYMSTSLDELKMLRNALAPSGFVYNEDVGFVWSEDQDLNMLALRALAYRTIMENASYMTAQKIKNDGGNWVIDGISNYVTARVVGERGLIKNQLDSFLSMPASFEWYGPPTPSQYGATNTLFSYLTEKYGDHIIDKTVGYMNSVMISNHRCDTLEQCALLRAVYDAEGININEKKYDLNFAAIVSEWKQYLQTKYGISEDALK